MIVLFLPFNRQLISVTIFILCCTFNHDKFLVQLIYEMTLFILCEMANTDMGGAF